MGPSTSKIAHASDEDAQECKLKNCFLHWLTVLIFFFCAGERRTLLANLKLVTSYVNVFLSLYQISLLTDWYTNYLWKLVSRIVLVPEVPSSIPTFNSEAFYFSDWSKCGACIAFRFEKNKERGKNKSKYEHSEPGKIRWTKSKKGFPLNVFTSVLGNLDNELGNLGHRHLDKLVLGL